ncbi:MAG TPA: RDD family protein [Actinotalea sp.]|nr:RDD family protein [Actinotalea sp.]
MAPGREEVGSWLEGTPGGAGDDGASALPADGPGSRARLARRVAALGVDWAASLAISALLWPTVEDPPLRLLAGDPMATLGVFAVSTAVLVSLVGHTLGHRLLGLRVVRRADVAAHARDVAAAAPPGLLAGALRTALLCLVVPAVIWDREGRGLHDVAARTVLVRR